MRMFRNFLIRMQKVIADLVDSLTHDQKGKVAFVTPMKEGELRITHGAVEDIIKHSTLGIRGLGKVNSLIVPTEEGLEISIHCHIDEGYQGVLILEKIREKVCNPVERYTGLRVKEVKVKRNEQLLGNNQGKNK